MIAFRDIREGEALPKLKLAVTPSLIVAGAMATNDYENVHHDKAAAQVPTYAAARISFASLRRLRHTSPTRDALGAASDAGVAQG